MTTANDQRLSDLAELVRDRPELFHVCCCDDDDLALCGKDVRGLPFTDGGGEQFCVVCNDLEDDDACPKYGRCRW